MDADGGLVAVRCRNGSVYEASLAVVGPHAACLERYQRSRWPERAALTELARCGGKRRQAAGKQRSWRHEVAA